MQRSLFTVVLATLVAIASPVTAVAQPSDPLYDEMIAAMERWLSSKPRQEFVSATARQEFEWKVAIEQTSLSDRYHVFRQLLDEIGQAEFRYEYTRYNERSLRLFALERFPSAYYFSDRPVDRTPTEMLRESYAWYTANVNDRDEQFYWLTVLMGYLSDFSGFDRVQLHRENPEIVHEVLVQYLALASHYLDYDRAALRNVGSAYSDLIVLFSTARPEDGVLGILYGLTWDGAKLLSDEQKELILDFVIPRFAEHDTAVKIFVALSE